MKAGIFDSGVGGLSVLKSILEAKMFDEIIYYGDTARVPYGVKDRETIVNFSLEALDFFSSHQIDILIVACNTVSAYALEAMQNVSSVPVVGVIDPGIWALQNKITQKDASILVIATKATIASGEYQDKLKTSGYSCVQGLATGLFVPIVEEGIENGEVLSATMKYYFSNILIPPKAIILGCTHFPLIASSIDEYFGHQSILIHSGEAITDYLYKHHQIPKNTISGRTTLKLYASSSPSSLQLIAKKWLNKTENLY
ncbi:glutamate racemase [Helicobacter cappadocius]|uniref:Glutamate racemase n=1 Tax=Helicobacter cappadocius TaxID=3063998 RepID=A0AA90PYK0_9HELI|nr:MULTISPECIES: glutamate racemase [unclassified Helicobacter]MDO7252865.1 glutamate racemase [Helicobacter sp. faydin-H75]MDP2538908.1 glutamate racemase [Helicobacter sp. faydin-H76]